MNDKLKRAGIFNIVLAALTFLLVAVFFAAAFSGALSKAAKSWQEGVGYAFFMIIMLPLVFIMFAAMAGVSVFWLVCGIKYLKAAKSGEYPKKLLVADAVTKITAVLPYALATYLLFALGIAFGVAACVLCAYFIMPVAFVFAAIKGCVRGEF